MDTTTKELGRALISAFTRKAHRDSNVVACCAVAVHREPNEEGPTMAALVDDVYFTRAPEDLQRTGLIGWIRCIISGTLQLDGIALRRTSTGRLRLSFPERVDGAGRNHPIVRPMTEELRREIERQILDVLGSGVDR